ncbi:unnamed protein product [Paramecium sonneborni]|uniref:Uncharacterized protein n=1 Tax=Paramecium sonneborni TaxID=65129 RepID=A0A8S1RC00_9CILI|nr:unnamed protein product [Paramecium sonneborni]
MLKKQTDQRTVNNVLGQKYKYSQIVSVCGDQIVSNEEDCNDGNLQLNHGCFNCQYSCPQNCFDCYQGICLECLPQYELLISNRCKQLIKCGDGKLQEQEECDDGNHYPVDGCINCLIEQNWICITMIRDSTSQCTYLKAPNFNLYYLNMHYNKQQISIQFDQRVKIQTAQPLSEKYISRIKLLSKIILSKCGKLEFQKYEQQFENDVLSFRHLKNLKQSLLRQNFRSLFFQGYQ